MKPSYKSILLAAAFIAGASAQFDVIDDGAGGDVIPDLTAAIGTGDDQAEVNDIVRLGAVNCDILAEFNAATTLEVPLSNTEILTFSNTFFDTKDGTHFEDGIGRLVWGGLGEKGDDETDPSEVSMAWATDPCDPDTFVLKITSFKMDGSTEVIRSIPCTTNDAGVNLCLVTLVYPEFLAESELVEAEGTLPTEGPLVSTSTSEGRRNLRSRARKLQTDTPEPASVDVMYLYTPAALTLLGGISPGQMFSIIYAGVVATNDAFENSLIPLTFNLAYVGLFPGTEDPSSATGTLVDLPTNEEVATLRDLYEADLVQLLGAFTASCSAAYNYNGNSLYGFSVVNPACIDNRSHSHAFGHNLGCYRNRENTVVDKPYEHGYRTCDTEMPFSTIMSVKCPASGQAPRINFYSNPEANWNGLPTGTATENCAQGIIDNMGTVESYRPVIFEPPTPTPASGLPTPAPTIAPTPVPTDQPTDMPPAPTPGYMSLGCWTDIGSDRVLSGSALTGQLDMTTEKCAVECDGSTYFGTEFGGECFCGLATDDPFELGVSTNCDIQCTGDADEICGGPNAINVYQYVDYTLEGCFVDSSVARVLTGDSTANGAMSTDFCAEFCVGYPWFGTEYGVECFCGSDTDEPDELGVSTGCNFECPGAPTEICGGSNAITVYKTAGQIIVTPAPGPISGATELGCYADTFADRVFPAVENDPAMTPELCDTICEGSKYFGLQYGVECWCGDDDNFDRHGDSGGCTFPCPGDGTAICGGNLAMSVYVY